MNKFKFYFILLITTISLFSCSKDDNSTTVEPARDYATQYATEIADIETYLKSNYITVINHPGFQDDQDITISKITNGETSIWNQTTYQLKSRNVSLHDITYKYYYLVLREGVGQSPSNADAVLASYNGSYLYSSTVSAVTTITATQFEESKFPQQFLSLLTTVTGWGETFPQFKTGTYSTNNDGTISHNDFGAGVMFIPSGLAYYNYGSGSIPAYSPLIFGFKLYEIQRLDTDGDGVYNYQEDVNGDGYMRTLATGVINPDDTDGDEAPNFLDIDDDGDNYTTKLENKDSNGVAYPFASIPSCNGNTIDPLRIKKYLDKTCH
jgi:hypothetical protein